LEALQMTKVWSCERLQRRCRYSKVLERLWPVNWKFHGPRFFRHGHVLQIL